MVHVLAVITAKPGQRSAVLKLFQANAPTVLAERGCMEYGAATDMAGGPAWQAMYGADSFVVIEKWADFDALQAHGAAPHMAAYAVSTRAMVASRAIHILSPA